MQFLPFSLPDPLHPAVIHFPIVLLLLGAAVAVVSVFVHRWHLPWLAAALLVMGAAGALVAVETGEESRETLGKLASQIQPLVDDHEEWAERTEIAAAIAAILALLAAAGSMTIRLPSAAVRIFGWLFRPAVHQTLRIPTAAMALLSCFFVYQTARRGGEMVYEHAVGVNQVGSQGKP